jgi:hypothetical protein
MKCLILSIKPILYILPHNLLLFFGLVMIKNKIKKNNSYGSL